jgi:mRNA interferase MazF
MNEGSFSVRTDVLKKHFLEWIGLKERLDHNKSKPPLVNERDLWWVSLGENVGSEMNGKSDKFSRPALILKKLSHSFYLIAPSTIQHKEGTWYVKVQQNEKAVYICLHQIRTIDYRRLWSRLGKMDESDFRRVKFAFSRLYK